MARLEFPSPLQALVNRTFVRVSGVNIRESEGAAAEYPSLSALFVRRLRPGLRSWPDDPAAPASPVDAVLGAHGRFQEGTLIQAKGRTYDVAALLAGEDVQRFATGCFFTLYLSPRHYHRVHAPVTGRLTTARVVPGRLFPVNPAAVVSVRDLFPRNERLVALIETDRYDVAVVAVGALNVGCISADFDPEWGGPPTGGVTNLPGSRGAPDHKVYDPPLDVRRGGELMAFHLGSTVVLLVSERGGDPQPRAELREGQEVRLGTPLLEGRPPGGGSNGTGSVVGSPRRSHGHASGEPPTIRPPGVPF